MSRKKSQSLNNGPVLFDVFYEDGGRSSNRRVPAAELGGLDGDERGRAYLEEQDRKVAAMSGNPPRRIKEVIRSGK